MVYPYCTKQNS